MGGGDRPTSSLANRASWQTDAARWTWFRLPGPVLAAPPLARERGMRDARPSKRGRARTTRGAGEDGSRGAGDSQDTLTRSEARERGGPCFVRGDHESPPHSASGQRRVFMEIARGRRRARPARSSLHLRGPPGWSDRGALVVPPVARYALSRSKSMLSRAPNPRE